MIFWKVPFQSVVSRWELIWHLGTHLPMYPEIIGDRRACPGNIWIPYLIRIKIGLHRSEFICILANKILKITKVLRYLLSLRDPSFKIVGDVRRLLYSNVYWHTVHGLSYTLQWWIWCVVLVRTKLQWYSQWGLCVVLMYRHVARGRY